MISRDFTLQKKKLYRSYQQSHWEVSMSPDANPDDFVSLWTPVAPMSVNGSTQPFFVSLSPCGSVSVEFVQNQKTRKKNQDSGRGNANTRDLDIVIVLMRYVARNPLIVLTLRTRAESGMGGSSCGFTGILCLGFIHSSAQNCTCNLGTTVFFLEERKRI